MNTSAPARVLDDPYLRSIIIDLIPKKQHILPLLLLSKSWHSTAQPALFRTLTLHEQTEKIVKVIEAIEHWQAAGCATHTWIQELLLTFKHMLTTGTADMHLWTEAVIRIIVHAPRARVISLQPCSPAMLSVAGLASGRALQHLKLTIDPHMVHCANVTCLSQFVQLRTLNIKTQSSGPWTQEKSVFAPGGRLPVLRRLEFAGSPISHFFEFLASYTFNALEEVDIRSGELNAEDWRHLHVFLDAHLLQTFTFSGDHPEEQTLEILRHARANQLGVDSDEHRKAFYASIAQAIPQATRIWVVDYVSYYEDDFTELMREIVRSASPLQAVLVRDRDQGPFHWSVDLDCVDVDYAGHRLIKVMEWARILANRGIRMLDEKRETLHEAIPIP